VIVQSDNSTTTPDLLPARRRGIAERVGYAFMLVSVISIVAVCAGIVGVLAWEGIHALGWTFFTQDPAPSIAEGGTTGGVRAPIAGTVLLIVISTLAVLPVALGAAIYLAEYMDERSSLTRAIRLGIEVLAGVPSVVFGMFGLAVFSVPWLAFMSSKGDGAEIQAAFGRSFVVASIVMAIHIMPFVVKVMEEAIRSVPQAYRDAAAGLGFTKWRAIRTVVLPAARSGLATAIVLGMGLVAGDTAIVWLTLGGTMTMSGADNWWLPWNWPALLTGTGSTLTTFTYFCSPAGDGNAPEMAFGAAFLLVLIVLALNAAVAWVGRSANQERS
jgi:phosphate transport system permease protein